MRKFNYFVDAENRQVVDDAKDKAASNVIVLIAETPKESHAEASEKPPKYENVVDLVWRSVLFSILHFIFPILKGRAYRPLQYRKLWRI